MMEDLTRDVGERVRRTRPRSISDDLGLIVQSNGRRVMKAVYGQWVRTLRNVDVAGFARQMIDIDTLLDSADGDTVRAETRAVEEPPRSLVKLPEGDDTPPLRGVRTRISLLDITDMRYSIRNGYLVDPERRVVYERNVKPVFNSLRVGLVPLEQPRYQAGTVAWLWNSSNYGHWLLYALPLIQEYRARLGDDPDYYYVGSPLRSYQIESLEMLGISRDRILEDGVRADRLLVSIRDRALDYDSELLLFAARNLVPTGSTAHDDGRRLFVSRAGALHRRLVNEAECAVALGSAFGLELVSTEGMKLADEIELFRGASLVVGAHGAGFTNIVFAPNGARVIELASNTYWDSLFAQIASLKEQPHALVRGPSTRWRVGVPPVSHNFEIDIDRLVEVVRAAIGTSRASSREPAELA